MAKILIDLNEHTINCAKCGQGIGWMSNAQLEEAIKNGVVIPDNATNGDVIKTIYHLYAIKEHAFHVNVYMTKEEYCSGNETQFTTDWWNAKYKVGDTDAL